MRRYILVTLAIFALYFIFLAGAWFIARSPVFRVQHVVVEGNSVIATGDVVTLLQTNLSGHWDFFDDLLGWNNMLAWPSGLSSKQVNMIPQLASVTIHKDYFSRTITASVVERKPFGIWCFLQKGDDPVVGSTPMPAGATTTTTAAAISTDDESCYWFDNDGVLFEKATNTEGNLIVVVHDYSQKSRGLVQKVLPDAFVANFISAIDVLHASAIGIQEIDINDLSLEEADVVTTIGPKIYFSLRFPADDYLRVLQSLVAQGGFSKLQYIDCRTEDRVYYR